MKPESRIYVAGHRGLLGSAVVRRLEGEGFRNLLLRSSAELDLRDQAKTFAFLRAEKPEFVFVCAARVGGIKANQDSPGDFLYENLQIQNNVLEGSRQAGVGRLLFVGSSCIYPAVVETPIREEALLTGPLEPTNEGYALAKIAGIRMCQFYRRQFGCDFISAIPTNLFGINDHYDLLKSHLLPALILKIHTAKTEGRAEIDLWGSGRPRREFMSSDDCADALLFLMRNQRGSEPLNVGTGTDLSVLELAELVASVLGAPVKFKLDPTKPDGTMRKVLDVSRLRAMGWVSRIPLRDAIQTAYQDFLKRGLPGKAK